MFTGLVEAMGTIWSATPVGAGRRFSVECAPVCAGLKVGDSVSVDGVCLTVTDRTDRRFQVDAVQETLSKTTLGDRRAGARVNLERSLQLGARLGGHLVQGHVDGTAPVVACRPLDNSTLLEVALPGPLADCCIHEGSIALDGVSLTIARLAGRQVTVALIPHTLAVTTLGERRAGDRVNVEVDLIGKYVRRFLEQGSGPSRISDAWLKQTGFLPGE